MLITLFNNLINFVSPFDIFRKAKGYIWASRKTKTGMPKHISGHTNDVLR